MRHELEPSAHHVTISPGGEVAVATGNEIMILRRKPPARTAELSKRVEALEAASWENAASLEAPPSSLAWTTAGLFATYEDEVARIDDGAGNSVPVSWSASRVFTDPTGGSLWSFDASRIERRDRNLELVVQLDLGEQPHFVAASSSAVAVLVRGLDPALRLHHLDDTSSSWLDVPIRSAGATWDAASVTDVAFDHEGHLWVTAERGVGAYDSKDQSWVLWENHQGPPVGDLSSVSPSPDGSVWIGGDHGLIRLVPDLDQPAHSLWEYRAGPRWLLDNQVHALSVDASGHAWAATSSGVSEIAQLGVTLEEKAGFFDEEIEKRHRRTPYSYVDAVILEEPGQKDPYRQRDSDNDGLWTSMYGAAQVLAWSATGSQTARDRARRAFRALEFLGLVTEGGSHEPPPGFIARSILTISGPDPNEGRLARDREHQQRDRKWKLIEPRWPTSADGQWFWKGDTSSDELDGHYFFNALYYDLVADEDEKVRVREAVQRVTDHLLANDHSLVDHDGLPTRWAVFSPSALNDDLDWWEERGLNSMSMLSYLRVAEHVAVGADRERYASAARELIERHGYAANTRTPKVHEGPGTGNQSDDEMAFMGFYNLMRYERDDQLRSLWAHSFYRYWRNEAPERNPLFHYLFAGAMKDNPTRYRDAFDDFMVEPDGNDWAEDSLDTLRRYPLDRIDWPLRNSHRLDIVELRTSTEQRPKGHKRDGKVLPIDERWVNHWNVDPWTLDYGGRGLNLADGASFLLPYYLGLHHGFIERDPSATSTDRP